MFQTVPPGRHMCLSLGLLEVISILVRKRNDGRLEEKLFHQALLSALDAREKLLRQGERLLLLAADKRLVRAAQAEGITALDPEVDSPDRLRQALSD